MRFFLLALFFTLCCLAFWGGDTDIARQRIEKAYSSPKSLDVEFKQASEPVKIEVISDQVLEMEQEAELLFHLVKSLPPAKESRAKERKK